MRRSVRVIRALTAASMLATAASAGARELYSIPDDGVGCETLARHAWDEVPRLFIASDADSLLALLDRWEAACGPHEVITRVRLLGAIWDGAFDESLYGPNIMADLATREAEFEAGDASDPARVRFDNFTVSLADQLIPHQRPGSLELFFALFYADRREAAWELLASEELALTSLGWRYSLELEREEVVRHWTVGAVFGTWDPRGDVAAVGDRPAVGLHLGLREGDWLLRALGELRPGRSDTPYFVRRDGVAYRSDRFDAWLVGGELGRVLVPGREWELQVFGGGGADLVAPFRSDTLVLGAQNLSAGVALRSRVPAAGGWSWGVDVKHEWIGDRNEDAVNLGGRAWVLRVAVERVFAR